MIVELDLYNQTIPLILSSIDSALLNQRIFIMLQLFKQRNFSLFWFGAVSYTHSDAADDLLCVDLGGRSIIKKKIKKSIRYIFNMM